METNEINPFPTTELTEQKDKILAKRALFKEILIDTLLKQEPHILKEYLNMELIDEMLEYSYKVDYEKFLKNIENGEI